MAAFPIQAVQKKGLYTAKISIKYKSNMTQMVKLSSHSDSAAAADDHDDHPKKLAAKLTSVITQENTL